MSAFLYGLSFFMVALAVAGLAGAKLGSDEEIDKAFVIRACRMMIFFGLLLFLSTLFGNMLG